MLAAVLVSVLKRFSDPGGSTGKLIQLICGLFLAHTLFQSISAPGFDLIEHFSLNQTGAAQSTVSYGQTLAENARSELIKANTEAYILDKATSLGCELQAEVILDGEMVPESVRITGDVSDSLQNKMQAMITEDLGIPKENQQWIGKRQ